MNSQSLQPAQEQIVDAAGGGSFRLLEALASELSGGSYDIPVFPDVAVRVRDALNDPDVSVDRVADIVRSDPLFTTQLLKLANSAMLMRGSREVIELKTAISRMGFKMVRNIAVSRAMDATFSAPESSILKARIGSLREHSIRVASLAYFLAKRQPHIRNPEEAMLAGLLHDIGKFYILTRVENFPDLLIDNQEFDELLAAWHTGVGRVIVESWGFLEQIADAVDEHEELDRIHFGPADIVDIVIVGNLIANGQDSACADMAGIPSCQRLNIDRKAVEQILQESSEELNSLSLALDR
ncbi:MAG: HDOD domain-containing protein [Gammaproteobacteria bacterium]|nr:HDOD domain-containing protein [Gammaproteobacteria bacterium]HXK55865.1 HDOD domain-containing protein [Gammaproteobacteria bacterium]